MVAEDLDDGEGEILRRVRAAVGPRVPIVASLDLHANVTRAMVEHGGRAGRVPHLSARRHGRHRRARRAAARADAEDRRAARRASFHTLDYLTGISSQCSFIEPCKSIYEELGKLEETHGCMLSFTPGFPMADFAECGMAVFGYGLTESRRKRRWQKLRGIVADAEKDFALELHARRRRGAARARARRARQAGGARRHAGQPGRRRQRRYHRAAASAHRAECAGRGARPAHRSRLRRSARTKRGRARPRSSRSAGCRRSRAMRRSPANSRSSAWPTAASPAPGRCSRAFA